jgi:SCO1/SenC
VPKPVIVGMTLPALTLWPACQGVGAASVTTLLRAAHAGRRGPDISGQMATGYFGYAFCPNSCPTALMDISLVLARLGGERARCSRCS